MSSSTISTGRGIRRRAPLGPQAERVLVTLAGQRRGQPPAVDQPAAFREERESTCEESAAPPDADLRDILEQHLQHTAELRDLFSDLDEDVLVEAATEARGDGADPVAAVDLLVRTLRHTLSEWDVRIAELGQTLTTALPDRPLPDWAKDEGRMEDVRLRQAEHALTQAVIRYHHGGAPRWDLRPRPW
ncbi:hypothetical protein AB0K51_24065 [Kitasatospora sp. NPDC049285]|uniref:hypothetical protein n=1 Tax=Kitasatospora sp. NPDC049285 TaxID=3157096 RepID=UPI00342CA0F7